MAVKGTYVIFQNNHKARIIWQNIFKHVIKFQNFTAEIMKVPAKYIQIKFAAVQTVTCTPLGPSVTVPLYNLNNVNYSGTFIHTLKNGANINNYIYFLAFWWQRTFQMSSQNVENKISCFSIIGLGCITVSIAILI